MHGSNKFPQDSPAIAPHLRRSPHLHPEKPSRGASHAGTRNKHNGDKNAHPYCRVFHARLPAAPNTVPPDCRRRNSWIDTVCHSDSVKGSGCGFTACETAALGGQLAVRPSIRRENNVKLARVHRRVQLYRRTWARSGVIAPRYFGNMKRSVFIGFMQRVSVRSQAAAERRRKYPLFPMNGGEASKRLRDAHQLV